MQVFHGCYTVQSCNLHICLYFLYFMGTVCTLSLRLLFLIRSQEIRVLLHNRRTSHSEQPRTFFSTLLISDTGLPGRIVQACYISQPDRCLLRNRQFQDTEKFAAWRNQSGTCRKSSLGNFFTQAISDALQSPDTSMILKTKLSLHESIWIIPYHTYQQGLKCPKSLK